MAKIKISHFLFIAFLVTSLAHGETQNPNPKMIGFCSCFGRKIEGFECGAPNDPKCPNADVQYKECNKKKCAPVLSRLTEAAGAFGECEGELQATRLCKFQVSCKIKKESECDESKFDPTPAGCKRVILRDCPSYGGIDPVTGEGATTCPTGNTCAYGFVDDPAISGTCNAPGIRQGGCALEPKVDS